jgi:hypothetical protein
MSSDIEPPEFGAEESPVAPRCWTGLVDTNRASTAAPYEVSADRAFGVRIPGSKPRVAPGLTFGTRLAPDDLDRRRIPRPPGATSS